MLNARNVITTIIVLALLSIAYTVYELARPPDAGGMGLNSYGVTAHGHRAIFEVLEELDFDARRSHFPPPAGLGKNDTLLMIAPDRSLVGYEPEHLRRTGEWIRGGGCATVALKSTVIYSFEEDMSLDNKNGGLLVSLDLPALSVEEIEPGKLRSAEDHKFEQAKNKRERVLKWALHDERPTAEVPVKLHEEFAALTSDVQRLRLSSEQLQVFDIVTSQPDVKPLVTVQSDQGVDYTLVARIFHGKGSVLAISDAGLFDNFTLESADNSVLAMNLVASPNRAPVFDEFYHGLSSRGNPLWLLTRPHYGWLFIMIVIAAAIWLWRQSATMGPSLPIPDPGRRTLSEYLAAMASLFTRSRQRKFVLQEFCDGVHWAIRQELHLAPGQENPEAITAALERQQPKRARQLQAANDKINRALTKSSGLSQNDFLQLTRELDQCL